MEGVHVVGQEVWGTEADNVIESAILSAGPKFARSCSKM